MSSLLGRMERGGINHEKMNRVLRQMKLKVTWEELLAKYDNYRPSFLPELFTDMSLYEVECFRHVYRFRARTVQTMRKELAAFVKESPQLYGDTLGEVLAKMEYYLKWCNAHNPWPVKYLNWAPQFGGQVQPDEPNAQIAYMREHGIPFYMTGFIPQ